MSKIQFFNLGSGLDPNKTGKVLSAPKKIGCAACGLKQSCATPNIEHVGHGNKKILIIKEYPGKYEDLNDTVYSKKAGKLIYDILQEIDIDVDRDCWSVHAVQCASKNYERPSINEINLCRPKLLALIEKLNPRVIIPLGEISLRALIGHRISGRLSGIEMRSFYGETIPDQELKKWICPTYSIEWLLRQKIREHKEEIIDPVLLRYFKRALKIACKKADDGFYKHNYESDVMTTKDPKEAIKWIYTVLEKKCLIAFDYETDGLKPHEDPHEIKTASFSDGLYGYAFPFFYEDEEFLKAWFKLMRSKHCKKVAHKMEFENSWTMNRGGFKKYVRGWDWDSNLAAHCINNTKPTGQKFWTYVLLGILNYDDSVDKYLKAPKAAKLARGANAFNRIDKANLDDTLIYNAQDSLFCHLITGIQQTKLKGKYRRGFQFFLEGIETLSMVHNEGMCVDLELMDKNKRILTRKIDRAFEQIKEMPEYKKWPPRKTFNPDSEPQLSKMLYDILKYPRPPKGESTTDKKQLKRLDTEFTNAIIPYREYKKLRDTYLAQFYREQVDGIIRAFFNLDSTITFRSSADSPSFQNMPVRTEAALRYVMSVIIPRLGNKLVEWDYKGVEVVTSACVHKDPNMIQYIIDESNDMHRDTAANILLKKKSEVTKDERQISKNGFVFPSFYGSGVPAVAPNIWEVLPQESKDHLYDQGVRKYKDFYAHMESVYDIFWNERFPVYRDWKRKIWKDYMKKGYIDLATGFRYYGPASFTQITNAPIQGPAFHVLLWTLSKTYPIIKENFKSSYIIGQIHDAMVGDINPKDEPEIDQIIKLYGTEKVREYWDWLILPFKLEKESGEINGSWNTMIPRGYI